VFSGFGDHACSVGNGRLIELADDRPDLRYGGIEAVDVLKQLLRVAAV
jgi:hypothetical protein